MHAKLLEIASRIHCPDSEGGKYAAAIKAEIEAIANEAEDASPPPPVITVKIEKVLAWSQRAEPHPQTPIYEVVGGWSEIDQMRKEAKKLGIYLGNGWVALVVSE